MQNSQDFNKEVNTRELNVSSPDEDNLSDSDLDGVSGGHNNGHGHGNSGKGNNKNTGDGSVRFIGGDTNTTPTPGTITDGTSNTIIFGE